MCVSYGVIYCMLSMVMVIDFVLTNLLCFSWKTPQDLANQAAKHWHKARSKEVDFRVEDREDLFISAGKEFTEECSGGKEYMKKVMLEVCDPPEKFGKKNRDLNHMNKFLEVAQESGFPVVEHEFSRFMPGGAPAICTLTKHQIIQDKKKNGGWQYPSYNTLYDIYQHSGISKNSFKIAKAIEVIIDGSDEGMDDWRFAHQHIQKLIREDKKTLPGQALSFDVEEVRVSIEGITMLKNWKHKSRDDRKKPFVAPIPSLKETKHKSKNIPARIIIGNGLTWMASIKFPWEPKEIDGKKRMFFNPTDFDMKQFETIFDAKFVVGSGINNDVKEIEAFITEVYGQRIKLPTSVEMHSLALLAGYRFPKTKLFNLQLILAGGVHNKIVSCADNGWGLPWVDLDYAFKLYALADVRHGYQCYVILISLIILNLFPDPVPVCEYLDLPQDRAFEYLSHMICATLGNLELNQEAYANARTRKELATSLRVPGHHSDGHPKILEALSNIIPPWPTVCYGSARDFHTVSSYFASQQVDKLIIWMKIVNDSKLSHPTIYARSSVPTDFERYTLSYGRDLEIQMIHPGSNTEAVLPPREDLKDKCFNLDPTNLTDDAVMAEKFRTNQPRTVGMLEWARSVRPMILKNALLILGQLGEKLNTPAYMEIWIKRPTLYQKLKSILYSKTNEVMECIPLLEKVIAAKATTVINQEVAKEAKLEALMQINKQRRLSIEAAANASGRVPTSLIDLQGKHYAQAPSLSNFKTLKRRLKRKKQKQKAAQKRADLGKARSAHVNKEDCEPQPSTSNTNPQKRLPPGQAAPGRSLEWSDSDVSMSYVVQNDLKGLHGQHMAQDASGFLSDVSDGEMDCEDTEERHVFASTSSMFVSTVPKKYMYSVPEAHFDPPSGYSDVSDTELDFSCVVPSQSKKKGKGKNRLPPEPEGEMSDDAIERLRMEIQQEKQELADLRREITYGWREINED